jgi:hypothetical protein
MIFPAAGFTNPSNALSKVLFPLPLEPMMAADSERLSSNDRPSRTNRFW